METQFEKINDEKFDAFFKLVNAAFQGLNAEKWLKGHIEETPSENLYGVYKGHQLVAGMRTFEFESNFSSTPIKIGGVGMLAVDMLHKKEKHAYHLMHSFFKLNEKKGINIVMLNPFKVQFYKKMGFGTGSKTFQFYIKPEGFRNFKLKEHLRELTPENSQEILDCYNRVYAKTHGMTKRFATPRELNRPFLFGRVVGFVDADQVKGYLIYSLQDKEMIVHELFFENPSVIKELSTFLHNQSDQVERIIINTHLEELMHVVLSPESGDKKMIDFSSAADSKHVANLGTGVMYRIIHLINFFQDLKEKKHNFNGVTLALKILITDDFYPSNPQSFVLNLKDGELASIGTDGEFETEIGMNISDFSSLVMGAVRFKALYTWGLATISDERHISKVNLAFATENPPVVTKAF